MSNPNLGFCSFVETFGRLSFFVLESLELECFFPIFKLGLLISSLSTSIFLFPANSILGFLRSELDDESFLLFETIGLKPSGCISGLNSLLNSIIGSLCNSGL